MTVQTLLVILLVGGIAGWLAGLVMRRGLGLVGNIIVGIIGAFVGGWLLGVLGVSLGIDGIVGSIVQAFIGAVVLLAVIGVIKKA